MLFLPLTWLISYFILPVAVLLKFLFCTGLLLALLTWVLSLLNVHRHCRRTWIGLKIESHLGNSEVNWLWLALVKVRSYLDGSFPFRSWGLGHFFSTAYKCAGYVLIVTIGYLIINFALVNTALLIKVNVLNYFYNSLYLHTLFAYVFILSTLYTFCVARADSFWDLYDSIRFTLYMIWSIFFYTPEDMEDINDKE